MTLTITGLAANETFDATSTRDSVLVGSVLDYSILGETSGSTCSGELTIEPIATTTTSPASTTSTIAPTTAASAAKAAAVSASPVFTG